MVLYSSFTNAPLIQLDESSEYVFCACGVAITVIIGFFMIKMGTYRIGLVTLILKIRYDCVTS